MLDYRLDLVKFFKKWETSDLFDDLYHILNSGDYYLKLTYIAPGVGLDLRITFGYIHNNRFFGDLKEFNEQYTKQPKYLQFRQNQLLDDLNAIRKVLGRIYDEPSLFKELSKIFEKYEKSFKPHNTSWGAEVEFGGFVEFHFEGLKFISFEIDGWYDAEDDFAVKDLTKILPKIYHQSIQNQPWFRSLEAETQNLVKAGESLLLSINYDSYRSQEFDYSPLLLDVFKAIEVEFVAHFNYHFKNISDLAKRVLDIGETAVPGKPGKKQSILNLMKRIRNGKDQFRPSGIDTPFKILYCLGLGEGIKWGDYKFESYLNSKQYELITRQKDVILDMQRLAEKRNNFVHEGILIDDNLLDKYQSNAIITLHLLADIKDYNMLSSSERFN